MVVLMNNQKTHRTNILFKKKGVEVGGGFEDRIKYPG